MFEYISVGKEWLMQNIDQERVWFNILGYTFKIGQKILNPLRDDKHLGSCSIAYSNKSNNLVLLDFADKKTNGFDCIKAYQYLNPHKSWEEVCKDLVSMAPILPTSTYRIAPGLNKGKSEVLYEPLYREWNQEDIDWWGLRGITLNQLERKETLTLPVSGYIQIKEGKRSELHFNEQCYCYHHLDKVKFYFPKRRTWRFLGNMTKDNLWQQNTSDTLVITKSHKDLLVIENCVPYTITHLQAETSIPSNNIIYEWELGYKNIFILLDNDTQGRKSSEELKKQFLYKEPKVIFIEDFKDTDEFFVNRGFKETKNYLNTLLCH